MKSVLSICVTLLVFCTQKNAADDDDCVTLGANNVKFCDVEKFWEPRSWVVDQDKAFVKIVILPAACTLLVYIAGFFYCGKKFLITYRRFKTVIGDVPNNTDIFGFIQSSVFSRVFSEATNKRVSFILFWFGVPVLKMLYDVIDVGLDCYYFWGVENIKDSLLSDKIYRNVNVNNVIFAFAILGAAKSILIVWVFKVFINKLEHELRELKQGADFENKKVLTIAKEKHIFFTEPMVPAVIIMLEDAIELHFEYHWVDKYITKSDTAVLFNATIMAILQTGLLVLCIKNFYDQFQKCRANRSWRLFISYINFYGHAFFFTIATVTRAYEVWGQTNSGKISPKCLKVEFERVYNRRTYRLDETNGRLIQTPYQDGCQSKGDQLIIAMMSFSMAYGGIALMAFIYTRWLLYKNKNQPELNIPRLEEQIAERTTIFLNKTEK